MTTVVLNTVTRKVEVFSSARDVQARAEIADHKAAADPHPQYLADADLADVALSGDAGDLTAGTLPDARMPNWTCYNAASRTALEGANVPGAVDGLRLLGHAIVGDGGGAHYKRVATEPVHPHKIQSADGAWWEELFAVDVTVSIPSDFATLQDAIDRLSKQPVRRGASIIVNIESGHALTAGITVENGDYSHFTITSDDAEVMLDAGWTAGNYVATFTNCRAPNWGILVNCGGKDCGDRAITVEDNTDLFILAGCGLKNSGGAGLGTGMLVQRNGRVVGSQVVLSGCAGTNLQLTHASTGWFERGDFRNGEASNGQGHGNVFVSRGSTLYAVGADFSGAVNGAGLKTRRSLVVAIPFGGTPTKFNSCSLAGIQAQEGSRIMANDRGGGTDKPQFHNCTTHGVIAESGSYVDVAGAEFFTVGFDCIRAFDSSCILAKGAVGTSVGRSAIICTTGAVVVANNLVATGVGGNGVEVSTGSKVLLSDANLSGCLGTYAIFANIGGEVSAFNVNVSNAAGTGLRAQRGSKISAPSSTGTGCGTNGITADMGGAVFAPQSNYSGATFSGATATKGSRLSLSDTNLQMGGAPSTDDCKIGSGSIIHFNGGTGGTNVTINAISAAGIIFQ